MAGASLLASSCCPGRLARRLWLLWANQLLGWTLGWAQSSCAAERQAAVALGPHLGPQPPVGRGNNSFVPLQASWLSGCPLGCLSSSCWGWLLVAALMARSNHRERKRGKKKSKNRGKVEGERSGNQSPKLRCACDRHKHLLDKQHVRARRAPLMLDGNRSPPHHPRQSNDF